MKIIGLTGGIGMGKSTLGLQLKQHGAKYCSADAIVHGLLGKGGAAVQAVAARFPSAVKDGVVNRQMLGAQVFADKKSLKILENILHPLVVAHENAFIRQQRRLGARMAVLDIPLLFETGAQARCDVVVVATAPAFLQAQRVLRRPGMTVEKFRRILSTQMPDALKKRRADKVVLTGLGKWHSMRQLTVWLKEQGL
jgi:dephospho-CoA kinase